MPNHITNKLTFERTTPAQLREILAQIQNDRYGLGSIDFNKIISLPQHILRGDFSNAERAKLENKRVGNLFSEYWDTNCNAYGYENQGRENYCDENERTIIFETSWSQPAAVVEKLSKIYPDIGIRHEWVGEDIGYKTGDILYGNGEEREYDVPSEGSKEAYEMSAAIMGVTLADLGYLYDEKSGDYYYPEHKDDAIITLEIHNDDENNRAGIVLVNFPASDAELAYRIKKARIENAHADCDSYIHNWKYEWLDTQILPNADLYEVNELAREIQALNPNKLAIFESMMQIENERNGGEPISLQKLIAMTQSTENCHVIPNITNDCQLGNFLFDNGFLDAEEENLLSIRMQDSKFNTDFFALFGKEHREGLGVITAEGCYVEWDGELIGDIDEAPEQTTGEQTLC